MADVRITCVTKPDRNSTHDRITHVGGPGGGGWRWPAENAIANIESGTDTFHVIDAAGHRSRRRCRGSRQPPSEIPTNPRGWRLEQQSPRSPGVSLTE